MCHDNRLVVLIMAPDGDTMSFDVSFLYPTTIESIFSVGGDAFIFFF